MGAHTNLYIQFERQRCATYSQQRIHVSYTPLRQLIPVAGDTTLWQYCFYILFIIIIKPLDGRFFPEICPRKHINYGKSSKILLVHRQTAQPQIRLPLKKQSDPGCPCLLFRHVVSSSPGNQHFICKQKSLRTLYPDNSSYIALYSNHKIGHIWCPYK